MFWLITLVSVSIIFIYKKIYKPIQFWRDKKVPYSAPWPVLGNMAPAIFKRKSYSSLIQDVYHKFDNYRYIGFYHFSMPSLMIRDPDLIKRICIKDFDKFTDRSDFLPPDTDPFWKRSLGSMQGEDWHQMRTILSPAFTSSKMKIMFCLMCECAEKFVDYFQKQNKKGIIKLEMKDAFTRLANDVIASTAFGITCNSLKDRDNEFYVMGRKTFDFTGIKSLKFFGYSISATLMKLLKVTFIDKKMRDFLCGIVHETIAYREKTGLIRPDMIHLLREAQKGQLKHEQEEESVSSGFSSVQEFDLAKGRVLRKKEITEEDIAAQGVIFFFAGFETVASLLCQVAYELAINPDVQERLIEEVDVTIKQCNQQITYEALLKMKYLDMVVSETLRLWPPAAILNRKAVKTYTIHPIQPEEKSLTIDVGTDILIPTFAIHRDPKYYPNPNKFDPERFDDSNKHNINPCIYMPFGTGPRNCIGNRFALLEVKTVIFYLLSKFKIVPTEKTSIPLVLSKDPTIVLCSKDGYWLGLQLRC